MAVMFDHFGIIAPLYEKVIRPKPPEALFEIADLPAEGILLDAGGGTGRISQFLTDKVDQVLVADLSHKMLQQTSKKAGLIPVNTQAEGLPFPSGTFSRIIMIDALHHVFDQEQTADELWRVLAPGGVLVIEEPDVNLWVVKAVALVEKMALMRSHFLTPEAIQGLFASYDAKISIVRESYFARVVVKKPAPR